MLGSVAKGAWGRGACDSARRLLSGGGAPAPAVFATEVRLLSKERRLEVSFNTGESYSLPAELLRASSEAAVPAQAALVSGRRHVGIMGVQPVGSYGVRLQVRRG